MSMQYKTYVNGKISFNNEASINATDSGLTYGWGVFETIKVDGGVALMLDEHVIRMLSSAHKIAIDTSNICGEHIKTEVAHYIRESGLVDAVLRITYTKGREACPSLIFTARDNPYKDEHYLKGFRAEVSNIKKNASSPLVYIKSLNYMDNILAKQKALKAGFDEAIMLNTDGYLCEGTMSNIFFIKDKKLYTPSIKCGLLPGIMRRTVIDSFKGEVIEGEFQLEQLLNADEAFVTNSVMGIMPLVSLETRGRSYCFQKHESSRNVTVLPAHTQFSESKKTLKISDKSWQWGKRTYIMGILNVTPDSFSDGGKYFDPRIAINHAKGMIDDGADIIDIGGESTRPGSVAVGVEEEMRRVIPVIRELSNSKEINIPISVDTYKAKTAEYAVRAGADMINDIWGLKADPEMAQAVAGFNVPICIMHNRKVAEYDDLIEDMIKDLCDSIEIGLKAGIKDENIIIDPGIGFGKTWEHNIIVMRHLEEFNRLGYPILLGTSRKSFIGMTLDLPIEERLEGTLATTVTGITKGIDIVRVHDVKANKRVAIMTDRMVR